MLYFPYVRPAPRAPLPAPLPPCPSLHKALTSPPHVGRRGVLVFSEHQTLPLPIAWSEPELFHFPVHGVGLNRPEAWGNEDMRGMVQTSLILCMLVGMLVGCLVTYVLYVTLQKLVQVV